MQLKTLQHQFQTYILNNDPVILSDMNSGHMTIYQNGYYARIIEAMKQDFPVLCEHLGESAFAGLITDYVAHYPSKHYNLRTVGKYLSEFIISCNSQFEFYADMARLEWLICCDDVEAIKSFESKYNIGDVVNAHYKM